MSSALYHLPLETGGTDLMCLQRRLSPLCSVVRRWLWFFFNTSDSVKMWKTCWWWRNKSLNFNIPGTYSFSMLRKICETDSIHSRISFYPSQLLPYTISIILTFYDTSPPSLLLSYRNNRCLSFEPPIILLFLYYAIPWSSWTIVHRYTIFCPAYTHLCF